MSQSEISKFLESCRSMSLEYSHVSLINPKGKFQMNRQNIEEFWNIYSNIISNDPDFNIGIAEKPQIYMPVIVDIDIKLDIFDDYEEGQKIIRDKHIFETVKIYRNIIKKIIENPKDENLICFVLEKPSYLSDDKIKNGFHLHFPYTFLSKNDQENYIIPKAQQNLKDSKIFSDLGFEDSSQLLDKNCYRVPWLLYGSKKCEKMKSYKLTKIINQDDDEITLEDALSNYKIFDSDERVISFEKDLEFYLPRILSIIPFGRQCCDIKTNLIPMIPSKPIGVHSGVHSGVQKKEMKTYKELKLNESLEKASKLVKMLSVERATDRNEWMVVGWALYNIGRGSKEALDIWLKFSSRCASKYNEDYCISQWDKMHDKNLGMGTLHYYAKKDSPEEYSRFLDENVERYIKESINGCTHTDIAKALHAKYGNEYVCSSISSNLWYQYENNRWKIIDSGVTLSMKISDDSKDGLLHKFQKQFIEMSDKAIKAADESEKAMYNVKMKQIQKVVSNLKSAPFKKNVMRECMELFYDPLFSKKIDKNPRIIGFKNGIYDLKENVFRSGLPEDYITLQMPIEYKVFNHNDKKVLDVIDYFQKVFPDKSVRDYFIDISSEIFVGGNRRKHVYFWSGEGDNGKSVTQLLFEKMLGEYAVKLPTSLIVGKRTQASAACPELVRAGNGVRWAVLQEPDKKDVINIGILKELSGNDTFFARGLYKEGTEIEPMMKLVVICNDPPMIPHSDKAVWNRVRVIPYESTFSDNAPSTPEEQLLEKKFPKDPFFDEKIPDMIQALAWYLLEYRKKNIKSPEPDKVKLATAQYMKKNDCYRQFLEERVIECKNSTVSIPELYPLFKDWFRESIPGNQVPTKNEFKEYLYRYWGEPTLGTKWKGYKIQFSELVSDNREDDDVSRDDRPPI